MVWDGDLPELVGERFHFALFGFEFVPLPGGKDQRNVTCPEPWRFKRRVKP